MTVRIRRLRGGDVWKVLAIERLAFPEDPWTLATGRGWLARSSLGQQARYAVPLAQVIRLVRLNEAIHLIRLVVLVARERPASLYYVVAETDATIAGFALLNAAAGGRGDVQTIAVRSDRQGEGIGTALLAHLIAAAAARECSEVFLYVRADNTRARQLYERTGFTEVKVRPGYYQPSGTDAIVMRLPIPCRNEPGNTGGP